MVKQKKALDGLGTKTTRDALGTHSLKNQLWRLSWGIDLEDLGKSSHRHVGGLLWIADWMIYSSCSKIDRTHRKWRKPPFRGKNKALACLSNQGRHVLIATDCGESRTGRMGGRDWDDASLERKVMIDGVPVSIYTRVCFVCGVVALLLRTNWKQNSLLERMVLLLSGRKPDQKKKLGQLPRR